PRVRRRRPRRRRQRGPGRGRRRRPGRHRPRPDDAAPDGLEVCRRLRRAGNHTPILRLTAREAVGNRVEGLDAGADDYVVKPFALAELLARLQALLRRPMAGTGGAASECLRFADLTLRPAGYEAYRGRRRLELTRTE